MLIKNTRNNKQVKIMDPDCAICSQPATAKCECEANGLTVAVRQAEQRMMTGLYNDIRTWVRGHAQDYILSYFSVLTTRRKEEHASQIHRITERAAYYYNARPHPSEISHADAELKRGIDEDWRASVQRYPEVLEYFFSLVELTLPPDDDPGVRDPPLSALGGGGRKAPRERERIERGSTPGIADTSVDRRQRRIGTPAGEGHRERRDSVHRERANSRPMTAPPPPGGIHAPPPSSRRVPPAYAPATGYAYVNPY
ncbi:Serine threonine phosphatase protein [Rutstroemia sp. NJR-2017a WRK4]|nr:Serine threonine phosphatase protein [Rutstroemia sp. NJR-2017a WRK4]